MGQIATFIASEVEIAIKFVSRHYGNLMYVSGALFTPFVASLTSDAFGFSVIGPIAGSLATTWQASLGSVAAGIFAATLQSTAMDGGVTVALNAARAAGAFLFETGAFGRT